ncbi:stage II sporulation protein E [Alicyclobacillus cycloheptanicus]|uniref:Stage II sporulation protein E n=1 Tax=Alicyclobacillus cycloheptanicus TaxID=1457 RepID=A0ABT9XK35_9BACL|nr:stage II sporulation protein E [Alicyclobacillus cycloheptanicus]MDQ0190143.1 stage II sporulation protein E [Alicyclobacillus cycloheptanicus]
MHSFGRMAFLALLAVLLGRASIENVVSPFCLAYFAVLTEILGLRRSWVGLFAIAGAYWHGGVTPAATAALACVLYILLRKLIFRKRDPDIHWAPFLAGFVDAASKMAAVGSVWTRYDVMIALAEGALVVILSVIFIQCLPLFTGRNANKNLRVEQVISLAIVIGSVIDGLSGVSIKGLTVGDVAVDWIVIMLATVGGPTLSTTASVVLGILSMMSGAGTLASVAVLGFAGLLSGVLKDAGRIWVSLVFVLSMGLLGATHKPNWTAVEMSCLEAAIAGLLCVLTPRQFRNELAEYVPGTAEHRLSEQQRVRRVRSLLFEKVNQMGQVFDELSATFAEAIDSQLVSDQQLLNDMVGAAAKSVCAGCPRRGRCWDREGYATYQAIVHTVAKLEESPGVHTQATQDLKDRCVRLEQMMHVLRTNLEFTHRDAQWIAKLREQRTLVAAQLAGVANVVRSIASEIDQGNEASLMGEEHVLAALEQLGLYVDHVHIVSLEPGKVEVEITQPTQGSYDNSIRVIAPLLSGIVGENITVTKTYTDEMGPCTSVFTSAQVFDVKTAVATVARDGRLVSGDTHAAVDLENGRYVIAVSDGMGNGDRAQKESKAALELLKKLLKAGFDEQLAVKTVNSTLLLRSRDEMFTTLDMALVDLFTARAEFLKVGSAPSFIRRGSQVLTITGSNVPIGILQDIEVQAIHEQLAEGDLLILMSDGVFDAPSVYDKEEWFKEQIARLETRNPQQIADTLIEAAVRINHGQIDDDMTVLVAEISRHQPEWAAIKVPGVTGLRRTLDRRKRGA